MSFRLILFFVSFIALNRTQFRGKYSVRYPDVTGFFTLVTLNDPIYRIWLIQDRLNTIYRCISMMIDFKKSLRFSRLQNVLLLQ